MQTSGNKTRANYKLTVYKNVTDKYCLLFLI